MNCPKCQRVLKEGAQFCTNCGQRTLSGRDPLNDSVPTVESSKQAGTVETVVASDPFVGRVLDGKYEIVGRLGAGGMGAVYRARRVHIGDEVALKVLHPKFLADESAVERFRREARAAAQLHHPNVVTIHDYGETQGAEAFAYIVMELVRGISLGDLLEREERLEPVRAVSLMRDICAGVGAAHRRNIVHRDVKPDNIIVLAADDDRERETVKVVDFGIAKLRDLASDHALTQTGMMVGTPYYMSPEQCRGEPLDARADVYSLGALLYEMLAGSPPFTAPSVTGVIAKHLTEQPPRVPASLGVPHALEAAVMRALAKDPQARQPDAAALARELQAAVANQTAGEPRNPAGPAATMHHAPQPTSSHVSTPTSPPVAHTHASAPPQSTQAPQQFPQGPPTAPPGQPYPPPPYAQAPPAAAHVSAPFPHAPPPKSRAAMFAVLAVVLLVVLSGVGIGAWLLMQQDEGRGARAGGGDEPSNTPRGANTAQPSSTYTQANSSASPANSARGGVARVEDVILKNGTVSAGDLSGLSSADLRLLRNTVYARHGRVFNTQELQSHFQNRAWYRPSNNYSDEQLTANDRANAALILAAENAGGGGAVDAGAAQKEIAAALEGWAAATRAHDLDAHLSFYADTLDTYYTQRGVSSERVRADRGRAFTRYATLDVRVSDLRISPDATGSRATAVFTKTWEFDGDRRSTGAVRQMVWLTKIAGRWLITGEKDLEVLRSGTEERQ
jgi:serine/threonine-protein kinase